MKIERTTDKYISVKLVGTLVDENDSEIMDDFRFELTTTFPAPLSPYSEHFTEAAQCILMAEFQKWYHGPHSWNHSIVEIAMVSYRDSKIKMRLVSHSIF